MERDTRQIIRKQNIINFLPLVWVSARWQRLYQGNDLKANICRMELAWLRVWMGWEGHSIEGNQGMKRSRSKRIGFALGITMTRWEYSCRGVKYKKHQMVIPTQKCHNRHLTGDCKPRSDFLEVKFLFSLLFDNHPRQLSSRRYSFSKVCPPLSDIQCLWDSDSRSLPRPQSSAHGGPGPTRHFCSCLIQ